MNRIGPLKTENEDISSVFPEGSSLLANKTSKVSRRCRNLLEHTELIQTLVSPSSFSFAGDLCFDAPVPLLNRSLKFTSEHFFLCFLFFLQRRAFAREIKCSLGCSC